MKGQTREYYSSRTREYYSALKKHTTRENCEDTKLSDMSDTKGQISNDSTHMRYLEAVKFIETEISSGHQRLVGGEMGSCR